MHTIVHDYNSKSMFLANYYLKRRYMKRNLHNSPDISSEMATKIDVE
jgi:hypothetical protein